MAMDAIAATVVNGGRAIVDIDIEAGRNKLISHFLYNEASGVGVCSSMETMPLNGKTAHHGGDV